jgi:hypothetical protein
MGSGAVRASVSRGSNLERGNGTAHDAKLCRPCEKSADRHAYRRPELIVDLIRDLGASLLDSRREAMSLRRVIQYLTDARIRSELLTEYRVIPPLPRSYGDELEPNQQLEVDSLWRKRELRRADSEFQQLYPKVLAYRKSLLESDVAAAVELARNRGVAHYQIVNDGGDWRAWRIADARITFKQLRDFIRAGSQAIQDTRILVLRASGSFEEGEDIFRKYFGEFAEALVIGLRRQRAREKSERKRLIGKSSTRRARAAP